MSCRECEIEYLTDRTRTLESIVARIINVMTFSTQSDETMKAHREAAKDLKDFRERWSSSSKHHEAHVMRTRVDCALSPEVGAQLLEPTPLESAPSDRPEESSNAEEAQPIKRGPGRPRKNP